MPLCTKCKDINVIKRAEHYVRDKHGNWTHMCTEHKKEVEGKIYKLESVLINL